MKKISIAILIMVLSVLTIGECFAQEEYEGFFKRMMKRFQKKEAPVSAPVVSEPPRLAPIEPKTVQPAEVKREMPEPEEIKIDVPKKETMVPREEKAGQAGEDIELTKEDMIEEITKNVDYYEQILTTVPSLKRDIDEDGNVYYTHEVEGVQKRLEEMSPADLEDLYLRVMGEASRMNAERILQQLEQVRQMQRVIQGPPGTPPKAPDIPRPLLPTSTAPPRPPAPPPRPPTSPAPPRLPTSPPRTPTVPPRR